MDLNEIAIFIQVVQLGSFTRAAQKLEMPNSTVSSKISALERRLGVTLIQRTTRKLYVTAAGQIYFQKCLAALDAIQGAEGDLAASQGSPQGLLKITAPVELGASLLPSIITEYTRKYSAVTVEVILTDRRVDLLAEGIDLAIRAGQLQDSSLIAKKLGAVSFATFAAPSYLKERGLPTHPKELSDQTCIRFRPLGRESWKLTNGKTSIAIPIKDRLIINDLNMVKTLAVTGSGIALLPTFFCGSEVRAGRLVRILHDWRTELNPVHFVYPGQKHLPPRLSAFMQMAAEQIKRGLSIPNFS